MSYPFWWTTDAKEDANRWARPDDEPAQDELADEEADRIERDATAHYG